MTTAAPTANPSYFSRASVQTIVLGAFVFLTLPIIFALETWTESALPLLPLYGVTFGLTHFLITGLLYLDRRNLRYFASSWKNRGIYFAIPIAILIGMDVLAVVPLGEFGVSAHGFLFYFVMFVNFLHVSRQSFGVLQLFKREARASHRESLRSLENLFFIALVFGQFMTFWGGGTYDVSSLGVQLISLLTVLVFVLVLSLHVAALRQGADQRADRVPCIYFTLQAIAGALVVYRSEFVSVALAMHYVEYHVVMMPRLLRSPVEPDSRVDRVRAALGSVPVLFYAGLLAVAWSIWFGQRTALYLDAEAATLPMRLLVHSLDGIFLFHFFIEAFLWKFSKPHYRETLGPLYFAPAAHD
jgi:hypothetical protein